MKALFLKVNMVVTEVAILKLKKDYNPAALSTAIKTALPIQDDWVAQHQPAIRRAGRQQTDAYIDANTDISSAIYLIAPWASPEGHWEWIRSEENGKANAALGPFLTTESDPVLLFHLESAGDTKDFTSLSFPASMTITRIMIKSSSKSAMQEAYKAAEGKLVGRSGIWAGWRIEKQDDTEELVVFWAGTEVGQAIDALAKLGDSLEAYSVKLLQ